MRLGHPSVLNPNLISAHLKFSVAKQVSVTAPRRIRRQTLTNSDRIEADENHFCTGISVKRDPRSRAIASSLVFQCRKDYRTNGTGVDNDGPT